MFTFLLHHFGISPAAFLGKGSESEVYALDQERVLRLYGAGASLPYIEARHHFYTQLAAHHPPFVFPLVIDYGVINDHPYTIEQRIYGQDLARVLPRLAGREREQALHSYLDLAAQIGTIQFPDAPFGEMILPGGLQRNTWADFLRDRAQQTIQHSRSDLEEDVPQLDRLIADFHTRLLSLLDVSAKNLVHGDYFPGNVFIDDALKLYAVGDWGYSTVVGDPRMDIAGAIVFMEVVEGYLAADTPLLLRYAEESYGISSEIIELYRLYYSFYFSHCKQDDPTTYRWCIENLRSYATNLSH